MIRPILLIIIYLFLLSAFAQAQLNPTNTQRSITGIVWEISEDDNTGMAISGANILLFNAKDSSMVKATVSDSIGKFSLLNINYGDYFLSISFLGYTTSHIQITSNLFDNEKIIDLGKIIIEESSILLGEVTIEGVIPELVIRGDTLEYNPAAFKTQEGAVVEDLLKKLPGIEVDQNGKITTFAGKEISKVFVNGKEFFGSDPKMATKNLAVEIVDRVQVIEKKTEQAILTGVDDGERETVINLTIKKDRMKGWMGNVTASGGALLDNRTGEDLRYNFQGNLMKFTENDQISFVAGANNVSNQGFSVSGSGGAISVISVGSAMPYISTSGIDISSLSSGGGSGITNSNSLGLNISKNVNKKLKMNGDIRYNYSDNYAIRNSFRTNLMSDSISYTKSSSTNQRTSQNIGFNARMEYKPDSLHTIVFSPRISFNRSESYSKSTGETLANDVDSTQINRSYSNSGTNSDGMALSGNLTFTKLFARKGRRLSFTLDGNLNQSSSNGAKKSFNEFFLQPDRNINLDQKSETTSNTSSFSLRVSYLEPLRENLNLSIFYDLRSNGTQNLNETFDYSEVEDTYSVLNTDYSKSMENRSVSQTFNVSLNATKPKYNYNIGMNIMPSSTQSTTFIKNGITVGKDSILNQLREYKVVNYSPQVNFSYIFSKQTRLNFTYTGRTSQPSVTQLDPTLNITNPLNIISGNPALLPSFNNSISLNFNTSKSEKQRSLMTSFNYGFTINEIINYTNYEPETGIQHTTPINENGSWNASGSVTFNTPIDQAKKLKLNLSSRLGYNNRIGYTTIEKQSQRNVSGTMNISESLSLSYNKNQFYGQLRTNANFNNTNYTIKGKENQRNVSYGLEYNTQLTLPWKINFNSDINYRIQRGLSTGYNKDEVLWNIGISRQCLKSNRGTLRFTWNDVLQKRLNISRNTTVNYIEDSEFNSLTSYILFSFVYRFNAIGGVKIY